MEYLDKDKIKKVNLILKRIVKNVTLPVGIRLIQSTLREWFPEKKDEELYAMILFKTPESLSFQRSDIYDITFVQNEEKLQVKVTLGFLSIFGASSPLPTHYNERVLEDSYETRVLIDFLEMLNHRLKKLIYPIWEKQRYYVCYEKDLSDTFSKYILSILGLYSQAKGVPISLDLHKLLPFSGILSMHQKSTVSLLAILKHYFEHEDIWIEEGVMTKSTFPQSQYVRLGEANARLGEETCIGSFVLTRQLKYRIHFDNLNWDDLIDFSLKEKKKNELKELIALTQKNPLSYDIALSICKEEIRPSILGTELLCLGANAWIGELDKVQSIVVEG